MAASTRATPFRLPAMINWQRVAMNLSRHMSLETAAKRTRLNADHLRRLYRGEVEEPRFNSGVRLLDLHLDVCPERHSEVLR